MSLAQEIAGEIAAYKTHDITLRRLTGTQRVAIEVTTPAIVRGYQPHERVGLLQEGDRQVIIGDVEIVRRRWPGPPRDGDETIIDGKTAHLVSCETVRFAGETVRHNLVVRGA